MTVKYFCLLIILYLIMSTINIHRLVSRFSVETKEGSVKGGLVLHVAYVTETKMIKSGVDGLSRGETGKE